MEDPVQAAAVEPEITTDSMWEKLNHTEYKIRRVFNKEFFNAEDLGATKPGLKAEINAAINEVNVNIGDDTEKKELTNFAAKLLALIAIHDFLRDGIQGGLKDFYSNVTVCGWEALKKEGWAPEFVEKVSGSSHFQAVRAIEQTQHDLGEAVKIAKDMENSPPLGSKGTPPTQEAIATMKRAKKKH